MNRRKGKSPGWEVAVALQLFGKKERFRRRIEERVKQAVFFLKKAAERKKRNLQDGAA